MPLYYVPRSTIDAAAVVGSPTGTLARLGRAVLGSLVVAGCAIAGMPREHSEEARQWTTIQRAPD